MAVRSDLPLGLQVAQSVHAAVQICVEAPGVIAKWHEASNNVVCVTVDDEAALLELASRAVGAEVDAWLFHEPDLDDEATAIAVAPGEAASKLCSNLPLTMREDAT